MVDKREKKGLLRRGCSRLARALIRCVIPCCYTVGRRHRGRGDSAKEYDVSATRVASIWPRDDELGAAAHCPAEDGDHCESIGSRAMIRGPTFFPISILTMGRTQTTTTGVIFARVAIYRNVAEARLGLLARPRTSAWLQWTVMVDREEWTLASVTRARNFWSDLSFRPRSRLENVPHYSPVGATNRGYFGQRPSRAVDSVHDQIQDQSIVKCNDSFEGSMARIIQHEQAIQCCLVEVDSRTVVLTGMTNVTTGRMQMVVVAPRLTEMASVIARVTVCPDLGYVEGLLTRPQIAAWSQWIAAVATVTICHVELSLAFVARLENFRPDPTTFRTDLRLTDVAFVSRRQPSNSLAFLTTRGHFGVRPVLQETDAVLRDTIQDQPQKNVPIDHSISGGLKIPREAFRDFNTVGRLIAACQSMSWAEPMYIHTCNYNLTGSSVRLQHVVECHMVTAADGLLIKSIAMDTTKRSAKRRAAWIILSWAAAVFGDAPTRKWGEKYGYDVRGANGTAIKILSNQLPRDGQQ